MHFSANSSIQPEPLHPLVCMHINKHKGQTARVTQGGKQNKSSFDWRYHLEGQLKSRLTTLKKLKHLSHRY